MMKAKPGDELPCVRRAWHTAPVPHRLLIFMGRGRTEALDWDLKKKSIAILRGDRQNQ